MYCVLLAEVFKISLEYIDASGLWFRASAMTTMNKNQPDAQ
jgi:hypothetical protein